MPRRNSPMLWTLPQVIEPSNSLCFKITVPNDREYIAAFRGALLELAAGYNWADDPDHKAREVALVWRNIVDNLVIRTECSTPAALHGGIEQDDLMPIRVDCDCNVWVTCCDGTEKQIFTSDQVQSIVDGSAVSGAPQPEPGGCASYSLQIKAGAYALLPVPVSSGDTILISAIKGATLLSGHVEWRCADGGGVFFAGTCSASSTFNPSNVVPLATTGSLVVLLGSTWYPVTSGLFTVPGGFSNVQPNFALNYPAAGVVFGDASFSAEVCNNQAVTSRYTHIFNFLAGAGPFIPAFRPAYPTIPLGNYVPGVGWQSVYNADGSGLNELRIYKDGMTPTGYDTVENIWTCGVNLDENAAGTGNGGIFTAGFFLIPLTAGTNVHSSDTAAPYTDASFRHDIVEATTGVLHVITLTSLTVSGLGPDPF